MRLYYFDRAQGNFGDDLNASLWPRLLPGCWNAQDGIRFAGIGTIVTADMPPAPNWIVFSSGAGYGPPPADFGASHWTILNVRGPLSAKVLGLAPAKAASDGALLLATLPEYAPLGETERAGTIFVPHHQALEAGRWEKVCERTEIEFVDPTASPETVIERIRSAKLVIADAMHAAIVADTMRVPWIPVASSREINSFKWLDWTSSVGLPYRPEPLPASSADEALRSAWLRCHGQDYFVPPHTPDAVLAHYRRMAALKNRRWWPLAQRAGERIYGSGLKRAVRLLGRAGLTAGHEAERLDRAGEALLRASAGPAFLSDDIVTEQHCERLWDDLEAVRRMARGADPVGPSSACAKAAARGW